ncbi:unnamed protein product [Echinostoma caproni]|uniref:KH_dom_type_1 domain-containing protein n=1 Tax=Echinostoma caproni TaxID=27848 RepID=A0A183A0B6_9TREM|nr:unnamed protein product [Echinostoma caproni]
MPITPHLQHLIIQCSGNVGGMKVPSVKLEMDGELIFLKPHVPPYGQREGALKALQKMEHDGVIGKVESSTWVTPIMMCFHSSDVVYFRGNDLRPASGITTRQLGQAMVEIAELNNATEYKRHVDQIHFKSSTDQRHQETSKGDNRVQTPSERPTEPHQSDAQT